MRLVCWLDPVVVVVMVSAPCVGGGVAVAGVAVLLIVEANEVLGDSVDDGSTRYAYGQELGSDLLDDTCGRLEQDGVPDSDPIANPQSSGCCGCRGRPRWSGRWRGSRSRWSGRWRRSRPRRSGRWCWPRVAAVVVGARVELLEPCDEPGLLELEPLELLNDLCYFFVVLVHSIDNTLKE